MNSTSHRYPLLLTTVFAGLFVGFVSSLPSMVTAESNTPSAKAERHLDKMHLPKVKEAAYLATPVSSNNPVPLLTTSSGHAIASIFTYPDGRQNLAVTADNNPELIHSLSLGYGLIKLGQQRNFSWSTPGILDKESEIMLRYLLKYSTNPLMFHQPNLRAYDGVNNLVGDLIKATVVKYENLFKLPIRSPSQHAIGGLVAARMAYNESGVIGTLQLGVTNTIKLQTVKPATIPITGISYGYTRRVNCS